MKTTLNLTNAEGTNSTIIVSSEGRDANEYCGKKEALVDNEDPYCLDFLINSNAKATH